MNTCRLAARMPRWLVAAGVALAALGATHAYAQTEGAVPSDIPELEIMPKKPAEGPAIVESRVEPFFHKVGAQMSCDFVRYRIRFGFRFDQAVLDSPGFADQITRLQFTLRDELPPGLAIETVSIAGDITGSGGGALPAHVVSTTSSPDDTVTFGSFQLSPADLDGFGAPGERSMSMTITARIDQAAFPAPTVVANQATLDVSRAGGAVTTIASHDPALPDDGDIATGEPTKITIDLTGCDRPPPPPPPGDGPQEACFKVETGEVDCTPGGGAFIYHMDVGPEMAGNVVQLKTTNPGVTIWPASQIVPPGGGTLSWTITGASPGDVVHLVVVGVEAYAGPAEGVGICCTQTVDLVIPEDLDCPDDEREPDIKVEKRADVTHCSLEGGCDFTITVSNAGDAPYSGKIVLEEVTTPGNADVVSGPNAPWSCVPGTTPMMCEHPATTLNPGESVELKLGFRPGAGWQWPGIRNCAEYDYTASGKQPFGDPTNDKACASIAICIPGKGPECTPQDEPRTDLLIRKIASPVQCTADGICRFIITVHNVGTSTHNGPLTVIDEFPTAAPTSVDFVPSPPWTCAPESASRFRCDHPPVVLVPGASIALGIRVLASDYPTREVENCGELEPVPGETDLTNNKACATAFLPRPERPRLTVEKTGEAECRAGEECTFEITITNEGDGDFSGPMNIGDAMEIEGFEGTAEITAINPPLGCSPEPSELPFMCEATITLGAGESQSHEITVLMPDAGAFPNGIPHDGLDGRNCFAVVDRGAVVTRERGPLTRAPEGDDQNGRYSCHPFTVNEPEDKPECSPGFVMNEAGRCVCPEGTTFRNGQCVGDSTVPTPTPRPTPPPQRECKLLPGQIRTEDGRCVCPRGTTLRNGRCVRTSTPPPQRECKLLPGQIRTEDGRCVCPRGTTLRNGRCVRTSTPPPQRECKLLPGQIRTPDGRCVCPRGTRLSQGRCVRIDSKPPQRECRLLPGQIRTPDGRCVCPRGTRLSGGRCVRIDSKPPQQQVCPPGTVGRPPNCRRVQRREPQLQLPRLEFRSGSGQQQQRGSRQLQRGN